MKRIVVLALAAFLTVGALAQGTFTIRKPLDNSIVREVVSLRIPKNSVPDGGYIGIYVQDKFLEATLPDIEGDDYVYKWNTQAKSTDTGQPMWADGKVKVECVLFVDQNGKPKVVNRSSINVTLDNSSSIKVPADGFKLRYKFTAGAEKVYNFNFVQEVSTISQSQAQLGGRAPKVASDETKLRILYATDNAFTTKTGREGLLRLQLLPDPGKDTALIIPPGETEQKLITSDEMSPLFMRITDVGREVFSSIPVYFGMAGQNGAEPIFDYYPILPLPVLPTKPVKPGDGWQSAQLFSSLGDDNKAEKDKFTMALPARGEFESLTWYKGMPCAVIHTIISIGPNDLKNLENLNQIKGDATNVKLEGRIWFALDRGAVARMEVNMSQESLIDVGSASNQGGGFGNDPFGNNDSGGPGVPGGGKGGGGAVGAADWFQPQVGGFEFRPQQDADGNVTFFQNRGRRGGGKGGAVPGGGPQNGGGSLGGSQDDQQGQRGQNPGTGRFGQNQQNRGGGGGNRKMVLRVRLSYTAELEK